MANILSFEAARLSFIDSPISEADKTTPRKVILDLKGLEEENKEIKIFISVKKDKHGNYILYYKNKFDRDASTIADYLVAVMVKQYSKPILHIFDTYHQEVVRNIIWEEGILKSYEEDKLDKDLVIELDWI